MLIISVLLQFTGHVFLASARNGILLRCQSLSSSRRGLRFGVCAELFKEAAIFINISLGFLKQRIQERHGPWMLELKYVPLN